jgi:uncharacterized protein (TIGR02246 family)
MHPFRFLPLVAIFSIGVGGCATQAAMSSEDALAVARSLVVIEEAAVTAKDAAAMANLYAPDGILQNSIAVFKGRDAIQKFREAGFKAGIYKEEISVTDAAIIGNILYDVGEFTVYLNTEGGPRQLKGRWGGTLVRSGNVWQIGMVTVALAPPPPAVRQ